MGTAALPAMRGWWGSFSSLRAPTISGAAVSAGSGPQQASKATASQQRAAADIFGGRLASQNHGAPHAAAGAGPPLRRFGSRRYGIYGSQSIASSCASPIECLLQPVDRPGVHDKAELGTVAQGFTATSTQIRAGLAVCNDAITPPAACCTVNPSQCCAFTSDRRALDQINRPFPWTVLSRSICRVADWPACCCVQMRNVGHEDLEHD